MVEKDKEKFEPGNGSEYRKPSCGSKKKDAEFWAVSIQHQQFQIVYPIKTYCNIIAVLKLDGIAYCTGYNFFNYRTLRECHNTMLEKQG